MCGLDAEKGGTRGERQNRTYVRTKSRSSANRNKAYSTEDGYCLVRLPLSSYMEWMTGPVGKGKQEEARMQVLTSATWGKRHDASASGPGSASVSSQPAHISNRR